MNSETMSTVAKIVFGGSVLLTFYVVYRIIKETFIKAEEEEIELGEIKNENAVNSLTPDELVNLINSGKEPDFTKNSTNTKKPTS